MGGQRYLPPTERAVFEENQKIMDLIEKLAEEKQQNNKAQLQLQRILERIYKNITGYGDASKCKESDEAYAYDTWRGLLNTIKAILELPGTDFVGAKMCLFLGADLTNRRGFRTLYEAQVEDHKFAAEQEIAKLSELCRDADDVLLGALRKIWTCSGQTESFYWVFTEHQIDRSYGQLDADLAVVLSLEEYKRRLLKRQQEEEKWHYFYSNRKLFTREEGETALGPDSTSLRMIENAKPITGLIRTSINCLDETGCSEAEINNSVYVFRRSWQFCLDAQQIAEANLGDQRQELLNTISLRHRIPREIHKEISSYLTDREPFPYLKKLDIGAAYTPFPTTGERCLECEHLDETSAIKRTCPQAGIYVWNLALRRFHCFHKNAFRQWSLCSHGSECKGHHDGSDHSWAVLRDPEFTLFIEKEAARGNDDFISLDQVGLGPVQRIRLDKAEDEIRYKRLQHEFFLYSETFRDWRAAGGLGGLVDSMLHGRLLVKAWNGGHHAGPQEPGTFTRSAEWAVGRNLLEQQAAELAIVDLHSWPGRCEWCDEPGKGNFARGVARSAYFEEIN
ncbi:hypothetical protein F52700_10294 [Fusarium sp. NRRL 52700]|nr:hypothetical protein F52700_10294 [Fusarium sp. NRRL 52700]